MGIVHARQQAGPRPQVTTTSCSKHGPRTRIRSNPIRNSPARLRLRPVRRSRWPRWQPPSQARRSSTSRRWRRWRRDCPACSRASCRVAPKTNQVKKFVTTARPSTSSSATNCTPGQACGPHSPPDNQFHFRLDSIEVKANWKPAGNRSSSEFYINTASDGKRYALVSMHIISKRFQTGPGLRSSRRIILVDAILLVATIISAQRFGTLTSFSTWRPLRSMRKDGCGQEDVCRCWTTIFVGQLLS